MKNFGIFPAPEKQFFTGERCFTDGGVTLLPGTEDCRSAFVHALFHTSFSEKDGNIFLGTDASLPGDEAYRIDIGTDRVDVNAKSRAGFLFAAATLSQLLEEDGSLPCGTVEDSPYMPLRGIHTYLPPKDGIDEFCRLLDFYSHLKYNTVFLEIGGGVEYESHPEINDAWRRFCREARDYPNGPQGLQGSEAHWKDSTHVELAGGDCLSKKQLMKIVDYARNLGIEIIPEIQALSHAYYLTLAHREIAEQPWEPWPDTYCPSNPDSYALYFDVAKELHDLIGFTKVSIGHDEFRILRSCPRCKNKTGGEILAHDLNTLHDFYAKLGVTVFMWGEGLQSFRKKDGTVWGEDPDEVSKFGRIWHRYKTSDAIDRIPDDIVMLDWAYTNNFDSEKDFRDHGMKQIYGNFHGTSFSGWEIRSKGKNVLGAEVSTWCVADENENARNGWFTEQTFSASVLWRNDFDDSKRAEIFRAVAEKMEDVRSIVRGKPLRRRVTGKTLIRPANPSVNEDFDLSATPAFALETAKHLTDGKTVPFAVSGDVARFEVNARAGSLTFLHAVDFGEKEPFKRVFTWFFLNRRPRVVAHYAIEYEDGLVFSVPVEFGVAVGNRTASLAAKDEEEVSAEFETGEQVTGKTADHPTTVALKDPWICADAYFTDLIPMRSSDGTETVYAWEFINPRPDEKILRVKLYADSEDSPAVRAYGCLI